MKTRLKNLYDCFYTPPEFSEQKQEVEECQQALIKVLEKPERRLVLRIMDAQSLMAEERSIDSFISGFELAWQLSMELNQFEKGSAAQSSRINDFATLPSIMDRPQNVPVNTIRRHDQTSSMRSAMVTPSR